VKSRKTKRRECGGVASSGGVGYTLLGNLYTIDLHTLLDYYRSFYEINNIMNSTFYYTCIGPIVHYMSNIT